MTTNHVKMYKMTFKIIENRGNIKQIKANGSFLSLWERRLKTENNGKDWTHNVNTD